MKTFRLRCKKLCAVVLMIVTAFGFSFATPKTAQAANTKYWIKVNKQANVATVYQLKNGTYKPIKAFLVSCGGANTPAGTFYTPAKYRWQTLMGPSYGQYCTRVHGGVLFHSVWYYEKNPSTQSTVQFNKLGQTASHGCIRLSVGDAKWIYDNCALGTKVTVYSSSNPGPLGKPKGIKVSTARRQYWDPTDPSKKNPYRKQKAIDSCAVSGGGTVVLQPGYYQTGALFIKSGVNLQLDKGVTLLASPSIHHYPEFRSRIAGIEMTWPAAVINIVNEKNASVSGEGTLDCRGKVFWDKYWEMRKEYEAKGLRWIVDYDCKRVRGILIERSSDITLKGFTLMRTGFWGCQILYSDYCTIDGLTINNNIGGHGPSTDGIDIDSSCNILVENCDVDCNDDNICIKSGRDADGLRVNLPTENVVIRNCIARKGAGLITCGSETSGSIRNVLGYNLEAIGTSAVLRLKSAMNRGGTIENIYMTEVKAENVRHVLAADLNWNPSYSYSTLPKEYEGKEIPEHWRIMLTPVTPPEKGYPRFRNVYVSKVKAENVDEFISASGWNDSLRLENFYLYAIEAQTDKPGKICYTKNFNLSEITLKTEEKNVIELKENEQSNINFNYVKTSPDHRTAGNLAH